MEQVLLQCHLVQTRHLSEDGWWEKCLQSHHHHYWSPGSGKPLPWELERPSCFLLRFRGSSSESNYQSISIIVFGWIVALRIGIMHFQVSRLCAGLPFFITVTCSSLSHTTEKSFVLTNKKCSEHEKIKGWFVWMRKSYGKFNKW